MSERESTGSPSVCSGDIYAGVPITAPGMDSSTEPLSVRSRGGFATPKSRSLIPDRVTRMFDGLRSR